MRPGKFYVLFLLAFVFSFCNGSDREQAFAEGKRFSDDTVFVSIPVSNATLDSLQKIYGNFVDTSEQALIKQGEFIRASFMLRAPLYPQNWTSDFENLFDPAEETYLDSMLTAYEEQTSNEIAVVTIDSTWTSREEFDQFILRLHNFWGVGKKEKNNGIVIGISRGYKIIRISNGYGVEKILTDEKTKKIIDEVMIPEFLKEDYYAGTRKGIQAIVKELDSFQNAR